jgi:hypothetical protein
MAARSFSLGPRLHGRSRRPYPTFLTGSIVAAVWRTAAWLALAALVARVVRRLEPRGFGSAGLATIGIGLTAAVAFVSLATRSIALPAEMVPELRARVPLLDGFDQSRRPTALLYDPLSRVTGADALSHVLLVARPGLRTAPQPIELLWNARFALPAGAYRLRLTRSDAAGRGQHGIAADRAHRTAAGHLECRRSSMGASIRAADRCRAGRLTRPAGSRERQWRAPVDRDESSSTKAGASRALP